MTEMCFSYWICEIVSRGTVQVLCPTLRSLSVFMCFKPFVNQSSFIFVHVGSLHTGLRET